MPFTQHAPVSAPYTRIESTLLAQTVPVRPLEANTDRIATFLDQPLDALGLTKRCANALFRAGLKQVFEVLDWTERDLRSLPNFGPASIKLLRQSLGDYGLDLRKREP